MTSTEITQQFAFGDDRIVSGREWRQYNIAISRNAVIAGLVSVLGGWCLLLAQGGCCLPQAQGWGLTGSFAWVGELTGPLAWVGLIAGALTAALGGLGVLDGWRRTLPQATTDDLDWARTLRGRLAEDAYTALRLLWLRGERLRTGKITDAEFEALTRLDRAWLERIREDQGAVVHGPAEETPLPGSADETPLWAEETDWIRIAITVWMMLLFAPFLGAAFFVAQHLGAWW